MIEERLANVTVQASGDNTSTPKKTKKQSTPQPDDEPVRVQPGAPPAVPLSQIHEKWDDLRRAVRSKNQILGAVLEHVEVRNVVGEVVTLTVQNDVFLERLNTSEHRHLLQYILKRQHDVPLKVRVMLAGEVNADTDNVDVDHPLVALGHELGAKVTSHEGGREQSNEQTEDTKE